MKMTYQLQLQQQQQQQQRTCCTETSTTVKGGETQSFRRRRHTSGSMFRSAVTIALWMACTTTQTHSFVSTTAFRPSLKVSSPAQSVVILEAAARRRSNGKRKNTTPPPTTPVNAVQAKTNNHNRKKKNKVAAALSTSANTHHHQHKEDIIKPRGRGKSMSEQFRPKHVEYEQAKLLGRTKDEKWTPMEANEANMPSETERENLSSKIEMLLNEESSDEYDDDGVGSTDHLGDIADRETVFSKLSDVDKSQATFAVSKAANKAAGEDVELEPIRTRHSTKKGKITANVLETGQDTMKQYVKSMGQHQVLSKEDEMILGKQIQILAKWDMQRQELEETLLRAPTFGEWAEAVDVSVQDLKKQVRRSQKAKAALVEANLRLVVTVARQTVKQGRSEINFQDACQEGILGLARACEKFDPDRGFRFSSYAVWWIKKMIHQNVSEQSRTVRLPANVMRKINDIRIHEKVLQDELGRKPKDEEIAAKVGMSVDQLEFYRKSANQVESLDKQVKFNKESDNKSNAPSVNEIVKDPGQSPADMVNKQMLKDDVRRLILTLSPREQAVIRLRFGLDNDNPKTLNEIGKKFSVDKEVIRKIEAKALRKLRQPYRNQNLKCYVSDL